VLRNVSRGFCQSSGLAVVILDRLLLEAIPSFQLEFVEHSDQSQCVLSAVIEQCLPSSCRDQPDPSRLLGAISRCMARQSHCFICRNRSIQGPEQGALKGRSKYEVLHMRRCERKLLPLPRFGGGGSSSGAGRSSCAFAQRGTKACGTGVCAVVKASSRGFRSTPAAEADRKYTSGGW